MAKINIDFDHVTSRTQGNIVKGSVVPRPIAWITTLNSDGGINLAPFSYFTAISSTLLAVSFQKTKTKQKDTFVNIMREKEAVVHVVDESLLEAMDKTGASLDLNDSEMNLIDLTLTPSIKVKTPGLNEALVRLEVIYDQSVPLTNYKNTQEDADLVILRVVGAVVDESVYDSENNYILTDNLKPVARLAGADYAISKKIDFKREF